MPCDSILSPKIWRMVTLADRALEEEFARILPASPVLCRILLNRGIDSVAQAMRFLNPDLDDLYDPSLLEGMDLATARTRKAIDGNEKIMVHGDYDVDGVTGTALLVRVLRILGADVSWYIPHRQREGYGISMAAIEAAKEREVTLIITVDCGTSAVEEVAQARSLGIDVIVTDHHEVGPDLPAAFAVINPRQPGCTYPFKELAGVGVAFKFAEALVREYGYDMASFRRRFCDLAAIGTVADVVPLLEENRTLIRFGLAEIPRSGKKGLRALLNVSGLAGRPLTSYLLAFVLAPRLNAAGRIDDASNALELLLTSDEQEAADIARDLDAQNKERQAEQERITVEALERIDSQRMHESAKVLVLSSKGWHPGIVGIVASKITDRYGRPAILVALDETGDLGVGSARSIAEFDLLDALMQCRHLLERCGGHSRAAGLCISADKLPEFDSAINRVADELLVESDLAPKIDIDMELELDSVTRDLAYELQMLEPYGHCNREPVFLSRRVLIVSKSMVGAAGAHLKLKLNRDSGPPVECIAFGWGEKEEAFRVGGLVDICYNIRINQFGGRETEQLLLRDVRLSDAVITEPYSSGSVA